MKLFPLRRFFLAEWSSSATATLQDRFKEITAEIEREFAARDPALVLSELRARLEHNMQRSYFDHMFLTQDARDKFDYQNTRGKNVDRPWCYGHLENGFLGARYIHTRGEAILSAEDLIRMWGYTKYALLKTARKGVL